MSVVPDKDLQMIEWFELRQPQWATTPTQIGLTAAQCTQLATLVTAARKAYNDQQSAKAAAKVATQTLMQAANGKNPATLRVVGSDLVKTIRAFAETTNNPAVYDKANFAPPSPPTPIPPPSQPTDVTATIEPSGSLTLRFKATSPGSGAVYLVKRKLAGESEFSLIGTADPDSRGNRFKSFTDDSLPAGANNFEYIFQGKRGSNFGPESAIFLVRIGTGGGGATVQELKMAA